MRALAVVPVVLFHAGVAGFSGGFVGVDVFFVVSGFLITSIIAQAIGDGTFTLGDFYERRVRRIFPALFLVVAACVPLAWIILVPEHLEDFGQSVISAGLFVANFFFYQEQGYFEGPAELHPLLHTWSLAVEEQYYLLFPLLLLWLSRHKIGTAKVLTLLALISFGISQWWIGVDPTAAFYMLPSRFWELLIGGLLALYAHQIHRLVTVPGVALLLSAIGLVMMGTAVFGFDERTPFPGVAALLPCFGAAFVIAGGLHNNPLNRLLGSSLLRGTGLISYSLYLWHFPLIVFARHLIVRPFTPVETLALILTSVVLAVLTWRFVEQPWRMGRSTAERRTVFRCAGAMLVCSIAVGLVTDLTDGAPWRMSPLATTYLEGQRDRDTGCMRKGQNCDLGQSTSAPSYLVWGDSHASSMLPAFNQLSNLTGINGRAALRGGCLPLLGYRLVHPVIADSCADHVRSTFDALINSNITTVFLAARWTLTVEESMYGYESGQPIVLIHEPKQAIRATNSEVLIQALAETLRQLSDAGKRVVIIGPTPEIGWHVPQVLAQRARFGEWLRQDSIAPSFTQLMARNGPTIKILEQAANQHDARLVLPHLVLCDRSIGCAVLDKTRPLYQDTDHLTITGALRLTELLQPEFALMAGPDTASKGVLSNPLGTRP